MKIIIIMIIIIMIIIMILMIIVVIIIIIVITTIIITTTIISISYRTVPSTIWPIFFECLIFFRLIILIFCRNKSKI